MTKVRKHTLRGLMFDSGLLEFISSKISTHVSDIGYWVLGIWGTLQAFNPTDELIEPLNSFINSQGIGQADVGDGSHIHIVFFIRRGMGQDDVGAGSHGTPCPSNVTSLVPPM